MRRDEVFMFKLVPPLLKIDCLVVSIGHSRTGAWPVVEDCPPQSRRFVLVDLIVLPKRSSFTGNTT